MPTIKIEVTYSEQLGDAIRKLMKERGYNQIQLAAKIIEKFPLKDNGKKRKLATMAQNVSNLLNGNTISSVNYELVMSILKPSEIIIKK